MNSIPDLLRLLAVPAFAWVAWRDIATRRVSDRTWIPFVGLGLVAVLLDLSLIDTGATRRLFFIRAGLSVGLLVPLSYAFWYVGGFGGADAKAFVVLALLFPAYPAYELLGVALPRVETTIGVFSLTVVTDTVLVGALYPLVLAVRNALDGEFSLRGFVGRPIPAREATARYGRLLDTGSTRGGLDLDALRMYLRWRGLTLGELRADRPTYRDPESLPANANAPGDGAIGDTAADGGPATDGGVHTETDDPNPAAERGTAAEVDPEGIVDTRASNGPDDREDPWGAAAFLDDIDSAAYGTTPADLREGLDTLTTEEAVWITPGIPFLVPLFAGLCIALVYGDLLFGGLSAFGLL